MTSRWSERSQGSTQPCSERTAAAHDDLDGLAERMAFRRWREQLWRLVPAGRILEVGVGTGANMAHYPPGALVTAVDRNQCMLGRARQRAEAIGLHVDLRVMDAERLGFPDSSFDSAVATLVFCCVSDPVAGLSELGRVVRAGGHIYLVEHMRSEAPWLGRIMDGLDWALTRLTEERFARRTVENARLAGLHVERVQNLWWTGIVRLVVASPRVRQTT